VKTQFVEVARNSEWSDLTPALVFADWLAEQERHPENEIVRWAADVAHSHLVAWLTNICDDTPPPKYPGIAEPFVIGGWLYATDGRIAIRIRTMAADTPSLETPDMVGLFDTLTPTAVAWLPWPTKHPEATSQIPECCPICDGMGWYYTDGESKACIYCDRGGDVEKINDRIVGKAIFAGRYCARISQLPNCFYRDPQREDEVLWFRFSGGDGLLMPMKKA